MATRRPSAEESALWHAAMRDVRRRPGARLVPPPPPGVPEPARAETAAITAPRPSRLRSEAPGGAGLDRRSAQRLRRGRMRIEARLDLHGMTQDEAHGALLRFIAQASVDGLRAVLVITGKGSRDAEGVLRRAAPRWLAEPACRALVLALEEAQPKHGGGGALYVLLRRRR